MTMLKNRLILFCCLVVVADYYRVAGQYSDLECYSCVSFPDDLVCLEDPESAPGQKVVACPNGWCIIVRQEMVDLPGQIVSFLRSCHKGPKPPLILNGDEVDSHQVHFFRSCRSNRCNIGDGIKSLSGSGGGSASTGQHIVKADSTAVSIKPSIFFLATFLLISIFKV